MTNNMKNTHTHTYHKAGVNAYVRRLNLSDESWAHETDEKTTNTAHTPLPGVMTRNEHQERKNGSRILETKT